MIKPLVTQFFARLSYYDDTSQFFAHNLIFIFITFYLYCF